MNIKDNINNVYEFKIFKFYNHNNSNNYIIYNNKKTELYHNNKKMCVFDNKNNKFLSKDKDLFMILYNATCHFLDIDIKHDYENLKYYDDYYDNNKNNYEIKEKIKKYILNKLKLEPNNEGLFLDNFKYFNDYVCEEIENYFIENKLSLKKYIIDELMLFDEYINKNISKEEFNTLNKTKHNLNKLIDIHKFYDEKMSIINKYFNKLINDKCSKDKQNIIINEIKNKYFYELCDYISDIYDIKYDILNLYINMYSYFDRVEMYH